MACCRQALFLSMPHYPDDVGKIFANHAPTKKRPFLIISEDEETLTLVNVTSDKFKFGNLPELFRAGYFPLFRYHPPF